MTAHERASAMQRAWPERPAAKQHERESMSALGSVRRWAAAWRPSVVTAGFPTLPLFVLFGLNAVDELDRTAFSVLLPDIRDDFGLSNTGALGIVSATTIAVLIISVPLSF